MNKTNLQILYSAGESANLNDIGGGCVLRAIERHFFFVDTRITSKILSGLLIRFKDLKVKTAPPGPDPVAA